MRYSINVNIINGSDNLKGFATAVFGDSFKITNIAILNNPEKDQLYVTMPRYKTNGKDENNNDTYKDICNPITKEFRDELYTDILTAYNCAKNQQEYANPEPNPLFPEFKVNVNPYEKENSSLKGFAKIYFEDCFVVNNISIHQNRDKLFVAMPSYKTKQMDENNKPVYRDVCYPVTKEFREKLYKVILETYEKEMEKIKAQIESKVKASTKSKKTKGRDPEDLSFR